MNGLVSREWEFENVQDKEEEKELFYRNSTIIGTKCVSIFYCKILPPYSTPTHLL